ncbi:hypothetical protein J4481_00630 [Candidatus Pacearchaeota archaeon]|nr:hypothetical protein [Candidatus Pacearchaeota archaeon]
MIDFLKYRTGLKSLDNFLKNLEYVEEYSNNFEEEIKFIQETIRYSVLNNKSIALNDFFRLLGKISNDNFFDSFIGMIYALRKEFKKEEDIISLENLFFETLKSRFINKKDFSPKLNTSGLYLRDFIILSKEVEEQKSLILNTLRILYELSKMLISSELDTKIKKVYLESVLTELNQLYSHIEYRVFSKEETNKTENINLEESFELKLKKGIAFNKIELFYLILYKIDKNDLEKDFFDICLRIYQSGGLEKEEYYKYNHNYNNLDWLNYDTFRGGAQTIPNFNQTKYRILISFYKYLKQNGIDIKKYEKENFSDYVHPSFENEIDNIDLEFLNKYFSFEEKKWNSFKTEFKKQLKIKIKEIKKQTEGYVINAKIKEEFRKQFIDDCISSWDANQKKIDNYIAIKYLAGGKETKETFGQYTLCDKIWFIDSFDKGVGYARTLGSDFARDQVIGKEREIITKINQSFDTKKDKEEKVSDIIEFLKKNIKDGEYILFYDKNAFEAIYLIRDINWNSEFGERASITVNNTKVFLYYTNHLDSCLLYKKGEFSLTQYKQGFEEHNVPLYVAVEELNKSDVKKIVESPESKIKSEQEAQKKVKIRISEKFKVKRNNRDIIYKINIKKNETTNTR